MKFAQEKGCGKLIGKFRQGATNTVDNVCGAKSLLQTGYGRRESYTTPVNRFADYVVDCYGVRTTQRG